MIQLFREDIQLELCNQNEFFYFETKQIITSEGTILFN